MSYEHIIVEKRGRIVCVTLNRPERLNATNLTMYNELAGVFAEYRDNPDEWVIIVTGAGERAFSSGADVKAQGAMTEEYRKTFRFDTARRVTDILQAMYKPVICAVNGLCVGAGWHFVADSDIVIASENAVFLDTHVNVGLVNGVESTGLAYSKMPLGIVMRMVMEGRHFRVSAQQAYQWGLVSEVVPLPQLLPRAWEIAQHIVEESAPLALQSSKKAILGALDRGYHDGVLYAWSVLPDVKGTQDVLEGPRAFAEKRKPRFVGR